MAEKLKEPTAYGHICGKNEDDVYFRISDTGHARYGALHELQRVGIVPTPAPKSFEAKQKDWDADAAAQNEKKEVYFEKSRKGLQYLRRTAKGELSFGAPDIREYSGGELCVDRSFPRGDTGLSWPGAARVLLD